MKIDKRSVLLQGQIEILGLLYKYRFGSRRLTAEGLGIKAGSNIYENLNVLMKHGLAAKPAAKKHLMRSARAIRSSFDMEDEISIYTATVDQLLDTESGRIWENIDSADNLFPLDELR